MATKIELDKLIQYREHQIASKSLTRKLDIELPFMVYAMDAGESISNEQSSLTRIIQVLDGTLTVVIDQEDNQVSANQMLVIPAGTLHEFQARQQCQFIQLETK